ncbi:MAG: efflux RND transporter periplasmic adaptor subunit [Candidatus Eisenbacteria bacterium]|nr:efflux RND transporter periplasmic adaptor subunit [Candidatus Eisenbacteria bacterium]
MRKRVIILVIIAIVAALVANRMWQQSRRPASKSIAELQGERGTPVSVEPVRRGEISESVQLTGTVEGIVQSDLVSRISERVVSVRVSVGQYVKNGQLLIQFDTTNPTAQYRQAKAAFEDAEKDFARMKALLEQGAISEQAFEKTRMGLEVARANFEAASSVVDITAPIDGVVTSVNVREGEVVAAGKLMCTVAQLNKVKVVVTASESEILGLTKGAEATISSSEGRSVTGSVSSISSSADPITRTFRVEITAGNDSRTLKPGSFATVVVRTGHKKDALLVPSGAVLDQQGKRVVFVVTKNNTAQLRPVTVGIVNQESIEILSGLTQDEVVVTSGHERLKGGEKLNVLKTQ